MASTDHGRLPPPHNCAPAQIVPPHNAGNDVVTNTFAQPGRGSGVCSHHDRPCVPNTCADVRRAAESDGLLWRGTELPTSLPTKGHVVSLHIWPQSNFHWLRMDANFTWSHKPGGSRARRLEPRASRTPSPSLARIHAWPSGAQHRQRRQDHHRPRQG